MSRILISYRREDTAGHAGRLYDLLVERFGSARVFMDVDTISPGDDFVEVIQSAVTASDVLIALIGREWLTVKGPDGRRRIDGPDDFVALELATALERNIRVVPVLVQGAAMPGADDLPARVRALARRNAFEIGDTRFRRDAGALIDSLERILEGRWRWFKPVPIAVGALGLAVLAAAGIGYRAWTRSTPAETRAGGGSASLSAGPAAPAPAVATPAAPIAAPPAPPTPSRAEPARAGSAGEGERRSAGESQPAPAVPAPVSPPTVPTREAVPAERTRPSGAQRESPSASPAPAVRIPASPAPSGRIAASPTPGTAAREPSPPRATPPPQDAPSAPSSPPIASVQPATAPRLVAPPSGASVPQPSSRSWTFRWAAPTSGGPVERYHLVVQGPGATWPVADITTSETSWTMPARGECSYILDRVRAGWQWKVRVQREGGEWSDWSTGRFDVEPVDRSSFCRSCPKASICAR